MTLHLPTWTPWLLLNLVGITLVALLIRESLRRRCAETARIIEAVRSYLQRSSRLYLVGRVRHPAGKKTVWDVLGLVATVERAKEACTTAQDFYLALDLDQIQSDDTYQPAPLVFPKREKTPSEDSACR
jgi:hypothetical protein